MTPQNVAGIVQAYLADRHPNGAQLNVLTDGIHQDQEWWYVPVAPDREQDRRYEYYETLGEVEREIQAKEGLIILFIPAKATVHQRVLPH
jgi:hypothetical protein